MPNNSILATAGSPLDAESERLFALMDANSDGQLTEAEGHKVADAFDCNKATFWSLLLKYDADGDGKISRSEFAQALKGRVLQAFFPRHAEKEFGAVVAAAIQALQGGGAAGPPVAQATDDARPALRRALTSKSLADATARYSTTETLRKLLTRLRQQRPRGRWRGDLRRSHERRCRRLRCWRSPGAGSCLWPAALAFRPVN